MPSLPYNESAEKGQLADVLDKYYVKILIAAHEALVAAVPPLSSWEVSDAGVREMLKVSGDQIVRISDTTKEAIRDALRQAHEDGLSVDDTAKRIDGLYDEHWKYRSQTIARTEMGTATLKSCQNRYLASDVVAEQEILDGVDFDDRCRARNGKRVPVTEIVELIHPNCTVAVAPILKPESEIAKSQPLDQITFPEGMSAKETEAWCRRQWSHCAFDYSKLSPEAASMLARELTRLANLYPDCMKGLTYFGTQQESVPDRAPSFGLQRVFPDFGASYGHSWFGQDVNSKYGWAISVNPNAFEDLAALAEKVRTNAQKHWFAENASSPAYVLTHEWGHAMRHWLMNSHDVGFFEVTDGFGMGTLAGLARSFQEYWKEKGGATSGYASEYAQMNDAEQWAEAFASLHHTKPENQVIISISMRILLERIKKSRKYDSPINIYTLSFADQGGHNLYKRWHDLLKELGLE